MLPTSGIGLPGNPGIPVNWVLYPISHPPLSNYFPEYLVVPAFFADWAFFSFLTAVSIFLIARFSEQ
jgi:hypothetical protein